MPELHGFGPALLEGTWMTIRLSLASVALGLLLGLLGASAKIANNAALRGIGGFYTSVVRGAPETLWVLSAYYATTSLLNSLGNHLANPYLTLSPCLAVT